MCEPAVMRVYHKIRIMTNLMLSSNRRERNTIDCGGDPHSEFYAYTYNAISLNPSKESMDLVLTPIPQRRELKLKEIRWWAQGQGVRQWSHQSL